MLATGTLLGSYRIERLLGSGGMGAVFLAHDTRLHRQVALKVLSGDDSDEGAGSRLLREARNAAALNHPNICTIYEVGEADGTAFIAMEHVEGRPLRDRIDEGALPASEAVRYGVQAADALACAHLHGVVHRDLKAGNVIVAGDGRLKVVDFGLARRSDLLAAGGTTVASVVPRGAAAGTPYAMAPEQVRGQAADARTDVWALGVLLYEMASGAKPFSGATLPELFSSILTEPPAALPGHLPTALRALVERCLEKDPARRPQQAGEVRAALEAIEAGLVAPWVAWRYQARRRPGLVAGAAALAIVAAVVGANVGGVRDRLLGVPTQAAPIRLAVLPFENLTGDSGQDYFSDGLTDEMITQLGRLHPQRLSVIARTSSMRYKRRDAPINQIGRELAVDFVMEGSARREGSRVRINVTLIQVSDQTQRWSDSFERELASILVLQSEVARGVAGALALTLLPAEQARLAGATQVDPKVYEAYFKGRFHAEKQTRPDLALAQQYFEQALEQDPPYAPAHAGLAMVWTARNQMGYAPPGEAIPQVRAAAMRAIALDGTLALAHYALALVAWNEWDWATSERELQRAIELDPNDSTARALYSHLLIALGRPDDAMTRIEQALRLDPLNAFIQAFYGIDLYFVRRYDEAIAQLRMVLRTSPDLPMAHCGLMFALNMKRSTEDGLAAAAGCIGHYGREVEDALARGYSEAGYSGAMRRAADALAAGVPGTYVAPIDVFLAYLHARQIDPALEWLSKAVDARDPNVYGAVRDPFAVDTLGRHPRFQGLLRRTKLEPE